MVFDGFYMTILYGRWLPFRCVSEREYFDSTGHLRVRAYISPLSTINDLQEDCRVSHPVPISNYEQIFKIKECYV